MSVEYSTALMYGVKLTDEQMTEISEVHYDIREDVKYEDFINPLNAWTGANPFIGAYVKVISEDTDVCMTLGELMEVCNDFVENGYGRAEVDEILKLLYKRGMKLPPPNFYIASCVN